MWSLTLPSVSLQLYPTKSSNQPISASFCKALISRGKVYTRKLTNRTNLSIKSSSPKIPVACSLLPCSANRRCGGAESATAHWWWRLVALPTQGRSHSATSRRAAPVARQPDNAASLTRLLRRTPQRQPRRANFL